MKDSAKANLEAVAKFLPIQQRQYITQCLRMGTPSFLEAVLENLAKVIGAMPVTYEQNGKGDDAIAHLHYFAPNADWYITEKDMEDDTPQAYGLVRLGDNYPESGYISIDELCQIKGVELDLWFTATNLKTIKKKISSAENSL